MNNLDKKYQTLLQDILDNGVEKNDRTGTGTISVFGRQIRHKISEGFPILTTKKMAWKTMVTELLWFLRGSTRGDELTKQGCHIWDGDMYANYMREYNGEIDWGPFITKQEAFVDKILNDDEFAKKWGELGPVYGAQWRSWKRPSTREEKITEPGIYHKHIDQIQNLINYLKSNPDSRRLMVSAWNPADLPITDYRTDDELYSDYLKDLG